MRSRAILVWAVVVLVCICIKTSFATTASFQGLGDLSGGSFSSSAWGVSADGSTVVGYSGSALGNEAFIWDTINGMRSLKDVLESGGLNLTGWTLSEARGISDNGLTIAGSGTNPSGQNEAWIATIPEPATLLLLGLGAVMVRKRQKSF